MQAYFIDDLRFDLERVRRHLATVEAQAAARRAVLTAKPAAEVFALWNSFPGVAPLTPATQTAADVIEAIIARFYKLATLRQEAAQLNALMQQASQPTRR